MSTRSNALAERLEQGTSALYALASNLTDEQWLLPEFPPRDARPIGVVVHHVASVLPLEIQLAQLLASGKPVEGVTMDDVNAMNAGHAKDNAGATRAEALELLKQNAATAAAAIRALSDAELDRAANASLYYGAPITCQFMLEDHAVRHSYHHLYRIRAALKRPSGRAMAGAATG
jgi:hypothetical protein